MRPLKRGAVNKRKSVRSFKRNSSKTKGLNMRGAPMRGGIRL